MIMLLWLNFKARWEHLTSSLMTYITTKLPPSDLMLNRKLICNSAYIGNKVNIYNINKELKKIVSELNVKEYHNK